MLVRIPDESVADVRIGRLALGFRVPVDDVWSDKWLQVLDGLRRDRICGLVQSATKVHVPVQAIRLFCEDRGRDLRRSNGSSFSLLFIWNFVHIIGVQARYLGQMSNFK